MKREQAREIGLFFLLGLVDERVALSAAGRAIAQLKASEQDPIPVVSIIEVCRASWKTHRKHVPRNQPTYEPESSWTIPDGLDIEVWLRYQKDAPDEDIMALLFSLVMGFSDDDLAEGFQTSVGTIRYRLGKGVRQLGLVARTAATKSGAST